MYDPFFFSLNTYPTKKEAYIHIDLYISVHCSFIYSIQNMDIWWTLKQSKFIKSWIDKQIV